MSPYSITFNRSNINYPNKNNRNVIKEVIVYNISLSGNQTTSFKIKKNQKPNWGFMSYFNKADKTFEDCYTAGNG
jgi:hypothetical protein